MNRLARLMGFGRDSDDARQPDPSPSDPAPKTRVKRLDPEALREPIIAALRTVYDPEIPVNLYDLGLIYRIDIAPTGDVAIDMTLTAPGCPVAGMMPMLVKRAVEQVEDVGQVDVRLVWDPPWSPERMSDEARLQLGLM